MRTILIVFFFLLLIGAFPVWPYNAHWGYFPGVGLSLILLIVLATGLMGKKRLL